MIQMISFLTVLRINYELLSLNEKKRLVQEVFYIFDNLVAIIIITAIHFRFILCSGPCGFKECKLV